MRVLPARVLLNTIISASKSLEACATQLEANAGLLEVLRADSASVNSLAAGVNYYASTTKAAHAAQSAHHKQVPWDWLSASNDKHPLKDALRSIRHHSECTSKEAYHLVETSKGTLDELKSQKVIMGEQCELLKTVAANQVELSKLMKAVGVPGAIAPSPPSGGLPSPSKGTGGTGQLRALEEALHRMGLMALRLAPAYIPFVPPPHLPALPAVGRFWSYRPVVAPNYEPNKSHNPPSAAYVSQDTPGRKAQPIQVVDDRNSMRSVSPTPHTAEQARSMNASYVPKGWVELQDGSLRRIYG